MLTVVSHVPEVLRCQRNAKAAAVSRAPRSRATKSEGAPGIVLARPAGSRLSLNERFSLLRAGQTLPSCAAQAASRDHLTRRLVFYVNSDWL